jgi:hypothetical protein
MIGDCRRRQPGVRRRPGRPSRAGRGTAAAPARGGVTIQTRLNAWQGEHLISPSEPHPNGQSVRLMAPILQEGIALVSG